MVPIPGPGCANAVRAGTVGGIGDALDGTNVRRGGLARRAGRWRDRDGMGGRVAPTPRPGPRRLGPSVAGVTATRSAHENEPVPPPVRMPVQRSRCTASAGGCTPRARDIVDEKGRAVRFAGVDVSGMGHGWGSRTRGRPPRLRQLGAADPRRSSPTSSGGASTSSGCRSRGRTSSRRPRTAARTRTTGLRARAAARGDRLHAPGRRGRARDGAEQLVARVQRPGGASPEVRRRDAAVAVRRVARLARRIVRRPDHRRGQARVLRQPGSRAGAPTRRPGGSSRGGSRTTTWSWAPTC